VSLNAAVSDCETSGIPEVQHCLLQAQIRFAFQSRIKTTREMVKVRMYSMHNEILNNSKML